MRTARLSRFWRRTVLALACCLGPHVANKLLEHACGEDLAPYFNVIAQAALVSTAVLVLRWYLVDKRRSDSTH